MNLNDLIRHELSARGHDPDEWAGERHAITVRTIAAMLSGRIPPIASVLRDLAETTGITPATEPLAA